MTEASLFLIIGAISVIAAVLMLLSDNAVHSALFLILVMLCLAFIFLMLNAPFLFLVQITVYAGAIMVLFLFVIMLLGAEQLGTANTRFRWMNPAAIFLSLFFLISVGYALSQGGITSEESVAQGQPLLRVAHFAPDVAAVDVRANGEVIASGLSYTNATDFLSLPAGEYELALFNAGTDNALLAETVSLAPGFTGTVLAYGDGVAVVPNDLSSTEERSGRVSVFNAISAADSVALVDFGSEFDANDTQVVFADIPYGTQSEALDIAEGNTLSSYALVNAANPTDESTIVARLRGDAYDVKRDEAQFIVLADAPAGGDRAIAVSLADRAMASFGSPIALGQMLFTRYMLPMQIVALMLLAAMVGAIVLTHTPGKQRVSRQDRRRRVSRPLAAVIAGQTGQDTLTAADTGATLPETVEEA